jgi:hypothetical protein
MTGQCTIVRIQSLFDGKVNGKTPKKRIQPVGKPHTQQNNEKEGKQTNNNEE